MSIDADIALWLSLVFIIGGLYVLAKSADMFVDASSVVARRFGISPLIVGMVIIGFGTSAPELVVSMISAVAGHPGLSLGNAYGSCIFNIAGILGVVALMKPIAVKPSVNGFAVPLLVAITGLSMFLVRDGAFSRCDGAVLLALFAVLLPLYCWFDQKMAKKKDDGCCGEPGCDCLRKRPMWMEWTRIAAGLALLVSSSHLLVWGSVDFARDILGASDLLIGLTIVAIGTSLPELASAIVSVRKGENEFVIGNIVGSNFFNTLAVVGVAGTISPFDGFSRFIILRDLPTMLFLSLSIALFSMSFRHPTRVGCVTRPKGAVWVLLFVVYSVVMAMQELSAAPAAPAGDAKSKARAAQIAKKNAREAEAKRVVSDDLLVQVKSTFDGTMQPCWFWAPEKAKTEPVPLVVGLHTWSADYQQRSHYATAMTYARKHGWAMVGPNFRGPNSTPSACGGEAAVQDIVDAVNYAKGRVRIDPKRVYIIGGSGGGHMTLLMAGRHPKIWAGCAAFCPITDLARWHADSVLVHPGRSRKYAKMMEGACGGRPEKCPEEYRRRSPLAWIDNARKAGVPVYIVTGIHDGWTGSVPVGHSFRAFNALADEKDRVSEADIAEIEATRKVPTDIAYKGAEDPFYSAKHRIHFRGTSANVRFTLFEGGHGGNFPAGLDFLSRQVKGRPADFTLPKSGKGGEEALGK